MAELRMISGNPNYKVLQSPYYIGDGYYYPYTCKILFGSNTYWSATLNSLAEALSYQPCY